MEIMAAHTDGRVGSFVPPVSGIGPCDRSRFAGTAPSSPDGGPAPAP